MHRVPLIIVSIALALVALGTSPASIHAEEPPTEVSRSDWGEQRLEKQLTRPATVQHLQSYSPLTVPTPPQKYLSIADGVTQQRSTILAQGFENTFPSPPWITLGLGNSNVAWGATGQRRSSGSRSAWCAQSGPDFPGAGQDVPPNTQSWMIAGPLDLSGTSSGEVNFDLWLETEQGFDIFFLGASLDGVNFTVLGRDDNTSGWESFTQDLTAWGSLGDLTGNSQVWFAFLYESDGSIAFEGAYVDNIQVVTDTNDSLNLTVNQIDADDCPQMRAVVSVTDGTGSPVQGLTNQNFTLTEDGQSRSLSVQTVSTGGGALSVGLVLDGSGSMSNADIDNIQSASNQFINLLGSSDRVAVYHFGTDVSLIQDFTTNKAAARNAVNQLTDNLGGTSLYDAIGQAANRTAAISGRKALIVMTDGQDNDSNITQQQAINAARNAGVPVFTIGFGFADRNVLQTIADQTGGLSFLGATSSDLQTILGLIGQTLNNQYILTWTAGAADGGQHDVTITVRRQGQSATRTTSYSQAGTACTGSTSPCVEGPTTLCLNQGRFEVEVDWLDRAGNTGPGRTVACGTDDSGLFWFFDPENWEMLVKVLNGCGVNGHYWTFFAATTNVGYDLTVRDTQTGLQKTYSNTLGVSSPAITDTSAFATCP
ncbi:MAG: VWA domain-containing protein [Acidobacteriota bacterium]|nr:VWA domain-containing protein [Acidobacteriota bacterium]